jgi:16S rRNA (cytidine1402-2'-O)-methyltransferase
VDDGATGREKGLFPSDRSPRRADSLSPAPPGTLTSPPGTLYVVATPIGDPEDITLRALRILREVDLIAAEDTRVSRPFLLRYGIRTPLTSYQQHSRGAKAQALVDELRRGRRIALVCDAGMPGISDPGSELIALALAAGVPVTPVPGATAAMAALAASGLPTARFVFEGFPPRAAVERRAFFEALRDEPRTVLLYESPRRLVATLNSVRDVLGERQVVVARELTKAAEEFVRGRVSEVVARFTTTAPAGECVLLLEGAGEEPAATAAAEERLKTLLAAGTDEREAIRRAAAALRLPRRQVAAVVRALKTQGTG